MTAPAIRFYQTGTFAVGNRLLDPDRRSLQADEERTNSITCGHRACQGCGEALGARYALDAAMRATNGRLIAANATGCLEVFSTPYPETSWQIAWMHSLFGNAPAVSTGIAAALRAKGRDDVRVVGAGRRRRHDGHRLRVPVGHVRAQRRRALRLLRQRGLHEHGRPAIRRHPARGAYRHHTGHRRWSRETFRPGKERAADRNGAPDPLCRDRPVAELRDLEAKVQTAMGSAALATCTFTCPCPLGWGSASSDTIKIARLAKESGIFPVFEAATARSPALRRSAAACPWRSIFAPQQRFAHLFKPEPRTEVIARIQASADRNIAPLRAPRRQAARRESDGETLRDHVRCRLQPGEPDGSWREERPVYVDRLPPCNHACPAGENIQHWLYHAESGDYEAAWKALVQDNPLPAIMGRVCYHPCETSCNRGQLDEAVRIHGVERFLGDEGIRQGWNLTPTTSRPASMC